MKLYSKKNITDTVSAMRKNDRFAHSFLLTGEQGVGKKMAALYMAMSLLCDDPDENMLPCGKCRQCRRIEKGIHPDVMTMQPSTEKGNYSVEYIREELIPDIYVYPNDGECKIYIIPNAAKLNVQCQNTLLKVIEEPPDHVYFIFTAEDKSAILPTVLSRVVQLSVTGCSLEECTEALSDMEKYSMEDIERAVSAYGGNIGKCVDFLEKGEYYDLFVTADNIAKAIIASDRYTILKELSLCSNRERFRAVLSMTDKNIRDCAVMRICGDNAVLTGCSHGAAKAMIPRLSFEKAQRVHEKLVKCIEMCGSNMNMNLAALSCSAADALSRI